MADDVAISGRMDERFVDPLGVRRGRYRAPAATGFSAQMRPETLLRYRFPTGAAWQPLAPPAAPPLKTG